MKIIRIAGSPHTVQEIKKFGNHLLKALPKYGFPTTEYAGEPPVTYHFNDDPQVRRKQFCADLTTVFEKLESPALLLVLLSGDGAGIYSDLKWWADCVQGVATVCITPTAVNRDFKAKGDSDDNNLLENLR